MFCILHLEARTKQPMYQRHGCVERLLFPQVRAKGGRRAPTAAAVMNRPASRAPYTNYWTIDFPSRATSVNIPPTTGRAWNPTCCPETVSYQSENGTRAVDVVANV